MVFTPHSSVPFSRLVKISADQCSNFSSRFSTGRQAILKARQTSIFPFTPISSNSAHFIRPPGTTGRGLADFSRE